jgi:MerR family transcriptional regulator, redox-sensitive transcriptional activator SoxR
MLELSIGQVAERTGLRTSTIRYYESINVLPAPRRRGGQRRYDPAVVERLAFIQTAQRLGFSLAEIELLFRQPEGETPLADRWQTLATRKLAELNEVIREAASIRRLLTQGLRCDCRNLHECIGCVLTNCREVEAA